MDLRQLECFLAVLEEDSFTLAARRLGLAQSTVSTSVRQLERSVGGPLLRRRHPPLSPTPLGEVVAAHAREIVAAVRRLGTSVEAFHGAGRTTLRIGVCIGGVGRVTPILLEAFARIPGQVLQVVHLHTPEQVPALLDGSVDAVLTFGPFTDERLRSTPLFTQERIAVVGASHELADAPTLTVADLLDRPQMQVLDGLDRGWADYWFLVPERGGEQPRRATGFTEPDMLTRLRGHAFVDVVTISPQYLVEYVPEAYLGVRYLPVRDLSPAVAVLVTRRDDPSTGRLAVLASDVVRDLGARAGTGFGTACHDPVVGAKSDGRSAIGAPWGVRSAARPQASA